MQRGLYYWVIGSLFLVNVDSEQKSRIPTRMPVSLSVLESKERKLLKKVIQKPDEFKIKEELIDVIESWIEEEQFDPSTAGTTNHNRPKRNYVCISIKGIDAKTASLLKTSKLAVVNDRTKSKCKLLSGTTNMVLYAELKEVNAKDVSITRFDGKTDVPIVVLRPRESSDPKGWLQSIQVRIK